jgi:DNA-binding response OmpR family regulator
MAHVLIIEDHQNISLALRDLILKENHQVTVSENLTNARELFKEKSVKPDLIILDWMLPDGQGLDFLIEIRKQGVLTPVIFLTARAEILDKVLGLEMGANDYLTKPFEPRELIARVRVQLRTKPQDTTGTLTVGSLVIDRIRHKVSFKNAPIELVKKEFELLVLLAESPEKVFSRDEILNKVWGYDVYPTTRTVDTHIMLLRQKINDELIETVRSVGYRLKVL